MRWINLEEVIPALLERALGVPCGPVTPGDLTVYLRTAVAGGSDDGLNDSVLVDVEAFSSTREGAFNLAEDARLAMHSLAGSDGSGDGRELIDTVQTATRPTWVDYRNPKVQRVVATYRVTTRIQ